MSVVGRQSQDRTEVTAAAAAAAAADRNFHNLLTVDSGTDTPHRQVIVHTARHRLR